MKDLCGPLFGPFYLVNLTRIRPQILLSPQNFMRSLMCFEAEISASWQHLLEGYTQTGVKCWRKPGEA
jgi:hypothetical protein